MNRLIPKCQNNGRNGFGTMGKTLIKKINLNSSSYNFKDDNNNSRKGYWFTDADDKKQTLTVQDKDGQWRGVSPQTDGTYKTVGNVNFMDDQNLVGENGEELTVYGRLPKDSKYNSKEEIPQPAFVTPNRSEQILRYDPSQASTFLGRKVAENGWDENTTNMADSISTALSFTPLGATLSVADLGNSIYNSSKDNSLDNLQNISLDALGCMPGFKVLKTLGKAEKFFKKGFNMAKDGLGYFDAASDSHLL